MHDHDDFLIIDLLDDPALTDADIAERLDHCAECLAELEAQRSVLVMLRALPTPTMTDLERRSLRSEVDRELDSGNVLTMPVRTMRSQPTRRWDWTRLGTVAAAVLGVFVIGGVVATLGTGGDDDAGGGGGDVTVAADVSDGAREESTEMAAEEAAPTDDAAADAADAGIAALARSSFVMDLGVVDAPTLAAEVDALGETIRTSTEASPLLEGALEGTVAECVSAVEDEASLRGALSAVVDGESIVVYFDADGEPAAFTAPDCAAYPLP